MQPSNQPAAKILVAIATYNERENLPKLVPGIFNAVPAADILVVDDNSPDGSGDWCDEFGKTDSRLKCIHRSGKLGLGSAAIAGIQYAMDHGFDLLINMDADLSHSPDQIPQLIEAVQQQGADVAIGSRYMKKGSIEGWPLRRRVSSRMVNGLARFGLGLNVSDCSGSFRCYRVATLRELRQDELTATGYSFYEEVLFRLAKNSAKFVEVPITFVERQHGITKLGYAEAIRAGLHLTKLAIGRRFGG